MRQQVCQKQQMRTPEKREVKAMADETVAVAKEGVSGIANKIRDIQILGIPFGEGVIGFGSALVISELTDGLITPKLPSNVPVVAIKVGEAYAMSRWGHKVIGGGGARMATVVLSYDALRTIVPIDDWIKNAIAKITGGIGLTAGAGAGYTPPVSGGDGGGGDAMSVLNMHIMAGGAQ